MKREFLKGLGVPEEAISKIMEENGNDIENAKKPLQTKIDSLTAANTELTTKNDSYKDYEELKKFKEEALAKEEQQTKLDFLKSKGCKHPELFVDRVDFSKGKYNAEKKTYEGLDEALTGVKTDYAEMFEEAQPKQEKTVELGGLGEGKGGATSNFNEEFRKAFSN